MSTRTSTVVLWLFVINLGVAFGAGVYEHRIVVPQWLTSSSPEGPTWSAEAAREADTGLRFWAFASTGPLTILTVLNLLAARHASGATRRWWLASAGAALTERLFTFAYFIPTMVGLMGAPDSAESVDTAARWVTLNHLRHTIVVGAWLAALQTFALVHQQQGAVGTPPKGVHR